MQGRAEQSPPGLDRCNDGNTLASPTIAADDIDPNHVYLGWAETNSSNTGQDIRIVDSHNGGLNFGAPVAANGPGAAVRFMPWLGAWGGVAYVVWYDRRFAGSTVSDPNDSTRYFRGSVSSVGGALTVGPEFDLMGRDDPQCERLAGRDPRNSGRDFLYRATAVDRHLWGGSRPV